MLFMFGYTRSLVSAAITLLAVIIAGLWLRNRTVVLDELTQTSHNLQAQTTGAKSYPTVIADYAQRLATLRADTEKITRKFVGRDYEAHMLVRDVVKAASISGMEMTNASKQDKKTKVLVTKGKGLTIEVVSYAIALKGSYTALVKFLQNLALWHISHKIESMEVIPAGDGKSSEAPAGGPARGAEEDRIEVSLVLSVFSLAQPMEAKTGN